MDYYEDLGDEVVVHLDYEEPEPSLYQQSSRNRRPKLPKEYNNVRNTHQNYRREKTGRRGSGVPSLEEYYGDHNDYYSYEEDQRDDMQMRDMSRAPPSNRTLGSRGSGTGTGTGTHTNSSSRPTTLRKTSSRSGNKSKMDLTRPDSDSSFELFAQLIVSHIEPKVSTTNDTDEYILEAGDISYFDAIIPATLRLPFVEAVRVRNDDLIERDVMPEEANALEQAVIKCDEFGLGMDEMDNFLLGGGEKLPGGRIRIKVCRYVDTVCTVH